MCCFTEGGFRKRRNGKKDNGNATFDFFPSTFIHFILLKAQKRKKRDWSRQFCSRRYFFFSCVATNLYRVLYFRKRKKQIKEIKLAPAILFARTSRRSKRKKKTFLLTKFYLLLFIFVSACVPSLTMTRDLITCQFCVTRRQIFFFCIRTKDKKIISLQASKYKKERERGPSRGSHGIAKCKKHRSVSISLLIKPSSFVILCSKNVPCPRTDTISKFCR